MRLFLLLVLAAAPLIAVEHRGTVRAADQFLPGVTVTARQGCAKVVVYTDENGRYTLDLTPGVWQIDVEMFGFTPLHDEVVVADSTPAHDWTLQMPRRGQNKPEPPRPVPAPTPQATGGPRPTPAPARALARP